MTKHRRDTYRFVTDARMDIIAPTDDPQAKAREIERTKTRDGIPVEVEYWEIFGTEQANNEALASLFGEVEA